MTPDPSLNINGYSFTSILTNSSKACAAAINSVLRASEDISITTTLYSNFPFKSILGCVCCSHAVLEVKKKILSKLAKRNNTLKRVMENAAEAAATQFSKSIVASFKD